MTCICRLRHIYANYFKHSSPHVVSAGAGRRQQIPDIY